MAHQDEWGRETADRLTDELLANQRYARRVNAAHDTFNRLQRLLGELQLRELVFRLDALHHDFYTATTEGEGEDG